MKNIKSEANLSRTQRDIIRLDISYIYESTLCEVSFQLSSLYIRISLPTDRIYSIQNALEIEECNEITIIKCNENTKIILFTNFRELQNAYYFPFISSDFSLEIRGVSAMYNVSLQICIPRDFALLDKFSYVAVMGSSDKPLNRHEVWGLEKKTLLFPHRE